MEIIYFYKKIRTSSLIILLVRKCLCVSASRGKPSIYFLLNIGYVVCVVYVVYVVYVVVIVVVAASRFLFDDSPIRIVSCSHFGDL